MVQLRGLIEYQEIEAQVALRQKRLSEIQSQLQETAELRTARAELAASDQRLRDLRSSQKSTELDLEQAHTRIRELEGRMMGNQVSPRDLQSVEREVANLKQRQQGFEDDVLKLMEEIEQVAAGRGEQARTAAALEAQWREAQGHLLSEKEQVEGELAQWLERRAAHASSLDAAARRLYDQIKAKRGGRAVVRIEAGRCSGCRITLPVNVIQRARAGHDVVYCSSCGRILYAA